MWKPTRSYESWRSMKARCLNPNHDSYKNYGGRGIMICERWMVFENFLADMGERPEGMTLDRIDNDGHYDPENCKWSTHREQRINSKQGKLTEEDVAEIKKLLTSGMKQYKIAEKFGVIPQTISAINTKRSWI
jgi:hypothetical protein